MMIRSKELLEIKKVTCKSWKKSPRNEVSFKKSQRMNNKERELRKWETQLYIGLIGAAERNKTSNSEESIKLEKFPKNWNETSGQ